MLGYYKEDCKTTLSFKEGFILDQNILLQLKEKEEKRVKELEELKKKDIKDLSHEEYQKSIKINKPAFLFDDKCKVWNVWNMKVEEKCDKWTIENDKVSNYGSYGSVHSTCCDSKCEYVLKFDSNGYNCNEVNNHLKLAEHRIAPPLYEVWKCLGENKKANASILIMKKLDKTFMEWALGRPTPEDIAKIVEKLKEKVDKMHQLGIVHHDLHTENIMIDNGEVYLIDFGRSSEYNSSVIKDVNYVEYQVLAQDLFDNESLFKRLGFSYFLNEMSKYKPEQDVFSLLRYKDEEENKSNAVPPLVPKKIINIIETVPPNVPPKIKIEEDPFETFINDKLSSLEIFDENDIKNPEIEIKIKKIKDLAKKKFTGRGDTEVDRIIKRYLTTQFKNVDR